MAGEEQHSAVPPPPAHWLTWQRPFAAAYEQIGAQHASRSHPCAAEPAAKDITARLIRAGV
ncbi:hypothetical protein SAMN02787118_109356 [Streptomyces mirabilis]|uniref:Uncharacterized protein n=1 Tax=Streptomyces mirabilis TaxID=68239 RepID=A0A1I2K7S5_9ACTN|nr:hypothetical protein SAMN02787118_109356 [Streptomyces mirabilis]